MKDKFLNIYYLTIHKKKLIVYINVCVRLKHCAIPQPKNLFLIYYVAQSLENNLISVKNDMMTFLKQK